MLPDDLNQWIAVNLPGVGDPRRLRFKPRPRIPFWWIPGNRMVQGLTLWTTIYLRTSHWPIDPLSRRSIELMFHELIHVEQFRRHRFLFPIQYLWNHLRYGYRNNPAEIEARDRAAVLTALWFRKDL